MMLPNRELGGQSNEFVSTIPELETITETHKIGAISVPGGYPGDSAGLACQRRSPFLPHAHGISGRKTVHPP